MLFPVWRDHQVDDFHQVLEEDDDSGEDHQIQQILGSTFRIVGTTVLDAVELVSLEELQHRPLDQFLV